MTEREVMAELVRFVGVLTYGKERWFKQNGCWYDRLCGDCIQNEVLLERITEAINDEIADRPTEWIPVSERLPGKDGRYLVTYPLIGDDLWVATAWYGTPSMPNRPVKGKCFFVSDDEYGDVPYDDVVAWMPLPEPYKGGESE